MGCAGLKLSFGIVILLELLAIMLQEGFRLSSSPVLHGRGTGHDVISFEACVCG